MYHTIQPEDKECQELPRSFFALSYLVGLYFFIWLEIMWALETFDFIGPTRIGQLGPLNESPNIAEYDFFGPTRICQLGPLNESPNMAEYGNLRHQETTLIYTDKFYTHAN